MNHLLLFSINGSNVITRSWCIVAGALWTWIEPTVPFALLSIFAVLIDCISAFRLNRRIRRKYGKKAADGKLKSRHMAKMVSDLFMLFSVMLIAQGIDQFIITAWDVPLGNMVAAIFLLYTLVSILENESSQNDNKWAILLQRWIADKTARHLDIDISDLKNIKKEKAHKKAKSAEEE